MRIGLGIFCSTSDNRLTTNHTFRLRNLNQEKVLETLEKNISDLHSLLRLSKEMNLRIFRLGSSFVPLASHKDFKREWIDIIDKRLREESIKIKSYGIRITMHPGQYVVLNSPRKEVVENSLRELRYHFWVLDSLGLGRESIVVVHVGGVYNEKRESIRRLEKVIEDNDWLKRRLAIENDEKNYNAEETIEIAESLGLPMVFDYYHHKLNPSKVDIDRVVNTWRGVTPEVHLSSSPMTSRREGEHGDYVDPKDFIDLISMFDKKQELDIIIEAKKKEIAVKKLIRDLTEIGIKIEEL